MGTKIARIAEIAKERPNEVFTSIYHLINEELLKECHKELKGNKATGIDDVTKAEYEENLDENIAKLHEQLARMGYRPVPAKRIYIPKANGKLRGIAIATYEDKIVQLALKKLIEAIYEPKFPKNMYGFRPKKSCHNAVNDLRKIIQFENINYVVEADIKSYFDNINHEWLMKGLELHIKDPRVLRMVKRFLIAGIMEDGKVKSTTQGTPQGSILSPLLANIYMYYMLVLWFEKKVQKEFKGKCYLVNFADDFVCCFELEEEAKIFYQVLLAERLRKFNLELAEDKTRMIEFGKYAIAHSKRLRQENRNF